MAEKKGKFLQRNRKAVFSIAFIVILSGLFSGFALSGTLEFVEQKLVDLRFQFFNQNRPVSPDIVFVDISDGSLKSLSDEVGGWPWHRGNVVSDYLINYIEQGEPAALLFDILYTEYSSKRPGEEGIPEADVQLDAETSLYSNLSHGALLAKDESAAAFSQSQEDALRAHFYLNVEVGESPPPVKGEEYPALVLPYSPLSEDSPSLHLVNRIEDSDGVSRNYNLLYSYQGHYLPSLAMTALKYKLGVESVLLERGGLVLRLSGGETRRINLDKQGRLPLNFNTNLDEFVLFHADTVIKSAIQASQGDSAPLVSAEEFRGKIVIVGSSAIGLKDQIVTPIGKNVAGPFFHITAISNVLTGNSVVHLPAALTVFLIWLLVSLIVVLTLWLKNTVVKNLIGIILILAALFTSLYAFGFGGVMADMSSIVGSGILAFLGALTFLSFTEGAEKNKISQAMGKYLAPAVMKEVLERYDELIGEVGEKKDIAVLFSDIRGFTSISEAYPPETVVSVLNTYLEEMIDVVFENQGTLDKMIGDAIMAFWGAPAADDEKELHAVRTAVAMIRRLEVLNQRLKAEGKIELHIGVGINTGPMIVGNIGSSKRLDYTLIGDNVNLGSRLEGLTKYYKVPIIVSGSTWDRISDRFIGLSLDSVAVKGKESGVPIFFPMIDSDRGGEVAAWQAEKAEFDAVRALYLARDFQRAADGFTRLSTSLDRLGGLAGVYQERSEYFLVNSPPETWDGCWKMLEK